MLTVIHFISNTTREHIHFLTSVPCAFYHVPCVVGKISLTFCPMLEFSVPELFEKTILVFLWHTKKAIPKRHFLDLFSNLKTIITKAQI